MFLFRTKANAQRKYIDLIYDAASKWPNWIPDKKISPGDFGNVDEKTGDFIVEGNIYTHDDTKEIAIKHPVVHGKGTDHWDVHSNAIKGSGVDVEVGANIPTGQGFAFQNGWRFSEKRGAILVMRKLQITYVPDEFFQPALHLPILKGKMVANEVWKCYGYYTYLSGRSKEHVTISLHANAPAGTPVVNASISGAFHWSAEGSTGTSHSAYGDDYDYTPLFSLRKIRKARLRRDKGKSQGEEVWVKAQLPWGPLDEEGEIVEQDDDDNGGD
ncbi:hypothetical protein BJV74DRAFT_867972 [Russula compacta]|nr:hypothetical protein BJV74DRAFT_867972 [Russula compacta]